MALETGTLPTTTAQDMIRRAYAILGDVEEGADLIKDQTDTGLAVLQGMLDLLSIDRQNIYQVSQNTHTWPANTTSRTIGSGGDFDTRRPDRIGMGTHFRDSDNIDYPVNVVINREVYDNIYDKSVTSDDPEILFYDTDYPLGTLYVYPVPTQALTLYLNQWNPLQVFDSLTEALSMPPGYYQMIVYNLAVHLEPEAGLPCPDSAKRIAMASLKAVKRSNNRTVYSSTESHAVLSGAGRDDIVAGR